MLLTVAVFALRGRLFESHAELDQARRLVSLGALDEARPVLDAYLERHPASAQGHLLAAEVRVKDESLSPDTALPEALDHLQQISDADPLAGRARIQEARIYLFLLNMPGHAERRLQKAMRLNESSAEPYYLMWKLFDLTGRSFYAEAWFRGTYRRSPEELRPVRLREWYMSQFYPSSANSSLIHLMEAASGYAPSGSPGELARFERFRAAEPENPVAAALIARWHALNADHQQALKILNEALTQTEAPLRNMMFVSTLISTLYDLGDFEQAWSVYERWHPEDSYEYHRWTGVLKEEVRGQLGQALSAYDRALQIWPGPADWRLMFRRATCLSRTGQTDSADRARKEAQRVLNLMEEDVHRGLRQALAHPSDPETIRRMIRFYEQLGMQNEVQCWREELARVARTN